MFEGNNNTDYEDLSLFSGPVSSGPMPRWQRKALETSHITANPNSKSLKRPRKTPSGDRFIPNRKGMDLDLCRMQLSFGEDKENGQVKSPSKNNSDHRAYGYSSILASSLLNTNLKVSPDGTMNDLPQSKILSFGNKAPEPKEGYLNPNRVIYTPSNGSGVRRNKFRHIPQAPEKILDAPGLMEDFYLNLVDWGSNNTLAVALNDSVYLWSAESGSIETLCETSVEGDCVTSVQWSDGNYIAIGTNTNEVQIWDPVKMVCVRRMRSHTARVGALAWNGPMLSSGSRDTNIHHHDTRIPQHHIATLPTHSQEVCGLKWSPNGTQLASGGNDNIVCVWDNNVNNSSSSRWTPKHTFDQHNAAVKALAWCPWQNNLLATGGGTADRHLRFWNTASGSCVNSIDTKSQVCSIVWSPHDKELVTSHGFSQNQLTVWKYPSLARMAELKGHTSRVLHLALSPNGHTVVSGAADETLRFWKIFDTPGSGKSASRMGSSGKSLLRAPSRGLTRNVIR